MMNSKMSRKIIKIATAVIVILLISSVSAGAITPYTTYTYNVNGEMAQSPHAYVPDRQINSDTIRDGLSSGKGSVNASVKYEADKFGTLSSPNDIFVDNLNHVYIADTGNSRIVCLDENYYLRLIIKDFVNNNGVDDSLSKPKGVYVTDTEIYVADTENNRIVIFDKVGNFVDIVPEPASEVFPEASVYLPIALAVDHAGRIYVVSSSTNYGVISLNRDGSFNGFIGPQKVTIDPIEYMWRMFQSEEQRAKGVKYVPTEYNNITIDNDGFLYVTTSSIDESQQQAAIQSRSRSDTYAPVKKLNPNGSDVMNRTGFYPPSGEVSVENKTTAESSIKGASQIIDVALGPCNMWSIIDKKRNKVFTYDENGNLLFIFGDIGKQLGQISENGLAAIAYQGTNILLLDSADASITVYKRNAYGDLIAEALQNEIDKQYGKTVQYYTGILQYNNNYDAAYIGIGQSLYRDGKYVDAMKYFKDAYDTTNYSAAYSEYRKEWADKNFLWIPIIIIVICVALSQFFKYAGKVNKKGVAYKEKRSLREEFMYGFHVIFHPFDGFWDIKHEKRASVKGATFILIITVLTFIYNAVGKSYLLDPYYKGISFPVTIMSVLLPVFLWAVSNWCLTTLFDGEGSFKDVYIATCYSLLPLPMLIIPATAASNIVTNNEVGLISMITSFAFIWTILLLFFGMMVIHDYTIGKNVITSIGAVVGMAIIMFLGILFSSLVQTVFYFGYKIYVELQFRWA